MRASDVHAILGRDGWKRTLEQLGIAASSLTGKHGPCPMCGGRNRFRFDNFRGQGNYFCNGCGSGDGFSLLMQVHGWSFLECLNRLRDRVGSVNAAPERRPATQPADRSARLQKILDGCVPAERCDAVVTYLQRRGVWPLPAAHGLLAHEGLPYWDGSQHRGSYFALIARVVDHAGELVTLHATYLEASGEKLSVGPPRKLLSRLDGRKGCAIRIGVAAESLGIAEGIESSLAATKLHGVPVWAACNAVLLASFSPPAGITAIRIFADNDTTGVDAANSLCVRLRFRMKAVIELPPSGKDWNDFLRSRRA